MSSRLLAIAVVGAVTAGLNGCGGSTATSASSTTAVGRDDTGVVTSEVPADVSDLAELRDLAYNMSPEEFITSLTPDDIDGVGGEACAIELAAISLALGRWSVDHPGATPTSLGEVADDPALANLKLWTLNDTTVEAVDGSGCKGPFPLL